MARKMVMKLDPDGLLRAYGVAETEKKAREIADRMLAKYRDKSELFTIRTWLTRITQKR